MCNEDKMNTELNCQCIHDLLKKICLIQKQDFCKEDFTGCDKPFLGPTPTAVCYNTRPIQLFNCCNGNLWRFPINEKMKGTITIDDATKESHTSSIFRVESLDDCCCTCRILEKTDHNCYKATNEFFTINLNCVGAIKCLPDVFVDIC